MSQLLAAIAAVVVVVIALSPAAYTVAALA